MSARTFQGRLGGLSGCSRSARGQPHVTHRSMSACADGGYPAGMVERDESDLEVASPAAAAGAVWTFREVSLADAEALADVRAVAMRPSLERLGVWDKEWARARFLRDFDPSCAWGISVDGELIGCIALRPDGDEFWLEHFLLLPAHQGRRVGAQALTAILDWAKGKAVRLNVLQRSEARGLYVRFGFQLDHEDSIGVFMVRPANPN